MKLLLLLSAGFIALAAVSGAAGLLLPATRSATGSREMAASRQRIWSLLTDLRAQPSWRPGIAAVEIIDEAKGRERWIERPRRGPAIRFQTERMSEPVEWVVTFEGPARGRWIGRLEELGPGRVRMEVVESTTLSNPWMRLLARFVFDPHAFVDLYLSDLARAAERKSA